MPLNTPEESLNSSWSVEIDHPYSQSVSAQVNKPISPSSTTDNIAKIDNSADDMPLSFVSMAPLSPEGILAMTVGIDNHQTKVWAKRILAEYHFPKNDVVNEMAFARHFFEYGGQRPEWAEPYRYLPACEVDVENHVSGDKCTLRFHHHPIGSDVDGVVFPDADDNKYVIKKYDEGSDNIDDIVANAESREKYYGDGTASVFFDNDENVYVRMNHVPGKSLMEVFLFPADAVTRYETMLHLLAENKIYHTDLNNMNTVLWDSEKGKFNPINFTRDPDEFEDMEELDTEDLYERMRYNTEERIDFIRSKLR